MQDSYFISRLWTRNFQDIFVVINSVFYIFKLSEIAILFFCPAKIEIVQKVANWRLSSGQIGHISVAYTNLASQNTAQLIKAANLATQ